MWQWRKKWECTWYVHSEREPNTTYKTTCANQFTKQKPRRTDSNTFRSNGFRQKKKEKQIINCHFFFLFDSFLTCIIEEWHAGNHFVYFFQSLFHLSLRARNCGVKDIFPTCFTSFNTSKIIKSIESTY